jgi:hypothetical protein
MSTKGMCPKFLRNQKYAMHGIRHVKEMLRKKVRAVVEKMSEAQA